MIVVDTGVLLAVADADDRWHLASTTLVASYRSDQLILRAPVIPETGWMIAAVLGPTTEAAFITSVAAGDNPCADFTYGPAMAECGLRAAAATGRRRWSSEADIPLGLIGITAGDMIANSVPVVDVVDYIDRMTRG